MMACSQCHMRVWCQTGEHELTFFDKCQICGLETTVVDCVTGRVRSVVQHSSKAVGIQAYLNTKQVHYERRAL